MKEFKRVLTSRASYRKQEIYTFGEFSEKELEGYLLLAQNHTFEKPLLINKDNGIFMFYKDDLGINIVHYHSFEKFREIK